AKRFASGVTIAGTNSRPTYKEVLEAYALKFTGPSVDGSAEAVSWEYKDILAGKHLTKSPEGPPTGTIKLASSEQIVKQGRVLIYPPVGPKALELSKDQPPPGGGELPPTVITSRQLKTEAADVNDVYLGTLTLSTKKKHKNDVWQTRQRTVDVTR